MRASEPEIFNTDQGSQFTGFAFTSVLRGAEVRISMDCRGQWIASAAKSAAVFHLRRGGKRTRMGSCADDSPYAHDSTAGKLELQRLNAAMADLSAPLLEVLLLQAVIRGAPPRLYAKIQLFFRGVEFVALREYI